MTHATESIRLDGAWRILAGWGHPEHLQELVITIETAITDRSDKAIDGAKCLVESVCKTILTERGVEFESDSKVPGLVKMAMRSLGLIDANGGEFLRDMASGISTATSGIASIRNQYGPLGHGRDAQHQRLGDWQRIMTVRAAETIAVMLYEAHEKLPQDLRYSRQPYDEDDEVNDRIDEAVNVVWDPESRVITINEFLVYRPSQILWAFDREAYVDIMNELPKPNGGQEDEEADEDQETSQTGQADGSLHTVTSLTEGEPFL